MNTTSSQPAFTRIDRALLRGLHRQALNYFLENQVRNGLFLDRQHNHGEREFVGLCSTACTGMGMMALAIASAPHHRLISRRQARNRIVKAMTTALSLKDEKGIMPHFVDSVTLAPVGVDVMSTIDSSWLIAGALWSAAFFDDPWMTQLAHRIFDRVDWRHWTREVGDGTQKAHLLRHGRDNQGQMLNAVWDRINAETAFMYVLAMGAAPDKALPPSSWRALKPFTGEVGNQTCISSDLGLFVFQYSEELLRGLPLPHPSGIDLSAECLKGTIGNREACRALAGKFETYKYFWGITAGDGPGPRRGDPDAYRAYAPGEGVDGMAHLMGTLASVGVYRKEVLKNIKTAERSRWRAARGRYGYSNINLDRHWFSRDVVGIDAGAAVLALENALHNDGVSSVFQRLTPVRAAVQRLAKAMVQKEFRIDFDSVLTRRLFFFRTAGVICRALKDFQ